MGFIMLKFSKRLHGIGVGVVIVLLMTTVFFAVQGFNDYKTKANLLAFQKREMQTTVENYINIIDYLRQDMKNTLKEGSIEYTEEQLKQAILGLMRHIVHKANFVNGAYIWINEVVNYDGGDDYAIRQVHGNLPETEGDLLSTNTQDAAGNLPYLIELEGIKKDGEITYNYFFQEYQSDKVSEKITYAKLYEPYNWIVCTGTYLNSMYEPTGGVSSGRQFAFYLVCSILIGVSLLLLAYMVISNFVSSRKLIKETELLKTKIERDSLSGAGSRAFGNSLLEEYLRSFKATGNDYSIAILDIDNFKTINDTYGHNIGDSVIKSLVETIREQQGDNDHIIRWGGDEFILTYINLKRSLDSEMDKLNKSVAEQVVTTDNGEGIHYTISIGASRFMEHDKEIADAIKRIDDALYLAKRNKNTHYVIG